MVDPRRMSMMDVDSEELERRTEDKMADTSHTNTTPSLNTSLSPSSAPSAVKDGSVYQLCSSPSKIAIHKSPNASLLLLSNYGGSDSEESSMEEGEDETNNEGLGNSVHNLSFGIVQANNISNTETDVLLKENTKSNDTLEGNAQISTNRDNNDQGNKLSQSSLVNEVASQMSNSNNTGSEVPVTFEGNNESSQTINLQGDKSKNIDDNAKNSEVPLEITCVGMKLDVKGGYRQLVTVDSESEDSESDSESSISSPSTSSSESESSSECEEISIDPNSPGQKVVRNVSDGSQKKEGHKFKKRLPRTPGELTLDELPPIEDLKISVPEELTQPIGSVFSIVEQQVVVAGYPNVPPIDLDSVLFVERGSRSLGQVFDVFGPVQTPFYVVRFNSSQHVIEAKIQCGDLVYFAPTTDHTNFVLLHELMRIRGSDASGMQGNEVLQVEEQDFSDDEEENRANLGKNNAVYSSSTDEFQSRPKRGRGHSGRGFHSHRENYNPFLGPREPRPSFGHSRPLCPRFHPNGSSFPPRFGSHFPPPPPPSAPSGSLQPTPDCSIPPGPPPPHTFPPPFSPVSPFSVPPPGSSPVFNNDTVWSQRSSALQFGGPPQFPTQSPSLSCMPPPPPPPHHPPPPPSPVPFSHSPTPPNLPPSMPPYDMSVPPPHPLQCFPPHRFTPPPPAPLSSFPTLPPPPLPHPH